MSFYHCRHDGTQEEQKCPPVDYSFIYLYANNIYYPFTYTRRFRLKHLSVAVSNVPPPKIPKITFIIIIFLISSLCTSIAKEKREKIWR